MMRPTIRLFLPRGRFSSMLDMGGMSSGPETTKRIDTGKNNEVRVIALDFDLITRSIEASRKNKDDKKSNMESSKSGENKIEREVKPDVSAVEGIAGLLGVKLGGGRDDEEDSRQIGRKRLAVGASASSSVAGSKRGDEDDLSLLTGETKATTKESKKDNPIQSSILSSLETATKKPNPQKAPPTIDIRSKYASKLRKKLESSGGSLSAVDRTKIESDEMRNRGDAADHLAARAAAIREGGGSGSKWMASTGTGALLSFLTSRSMTVALLPPPSSIITSSSSSSSSFFSTNDEQEPNKKIIDKHLQTKMKDLSTQLPNTQIDIQLSYTNLSPTSLLNIITNKTSITPKSTLVVSDSDFYLRIAKELGMYTCRVRFSKNAPRGNVSTNYDVVDVGEVVDVVNEINGISFHSVLGGYGKKIDHGGV